MQIIKKIFTIFLLGFFILSNINLVSALSLDMNKYSHLDESKKALLTIKNWEKYVKKIDSIVEKLSNNEKKLQLIETKINKIIYKDKKIFNINTYFILYYFRDKVNEAIIKIEEEKRKEGLKVFDSVLSEEENKIFEDKLVKLQNTLFENWFSHFEKLLKDFDKYTNYKESWNLNIGANFDKEEFWKFDFDLKLKNYLVKNSNFDSSFTTQIEALINAAPKWEEALKLQFSSFIDFISKDWNAYILLKDLKILDKKNIKDFKSFIDSAKEIAKKNKYVKYSDSQSQMAINIYRNLNLQNILADWKKIFSKPLLKAYKKEWDKYFLIPTKYACDSMKNLSWKFDPFHSNSKCSESQYNDLLEELLNKWELYLELWKLNKFGFNSIKTDEIDEANWYITFSDKYIEEINFKIIPNQKKYSNDNFSLEYKRNNSLKFNLIVKDENIKYNFDSKLDNKNKFNFIDFKWHTANKNDDFAVNFSLKNHIISWNIEANTSKYNWESWKSEKNNNFKILISWKTNIKNELDNIKFNLVWKSISTNKKIEEANLKYSKWNISFEIKYNDENSEDNLKLNYLLDSHNNLNDLDFYLSVKSREWKFDYNTYKYVYTWALVEIVNSNLSLHNSKILWKTVIKEANWDNLFTVVHTWKYWVNTLDLKNNFEFWKNPLESLSWNVEMAKKSKVISDVSNLATKITILNFQWNSFSEMLLDWNKINFNVLEENEENFKNPNWDDYLLFVKDNKFQVYWTYIDEKGNKIAYIRWNSLESLVKINWKVIKNWDIVLKGEIEKKQEKKLSWEFDIKYDVNNNKDNFDLYFSLKENSEKFVEYKIKNESKRVYKDNVEIKTPKNSINIDEVIPSTYSDLYY